MWIGLFDHPRTASNYVGYVKWACVHMGLSTEWFNGIVLQTLGGLKKYSTLVVPTTVKGNRLLTEQQFVRLVAMADTAALPGTAEAFIVWWEFLLRVPSEGISLLKGSSEAEFQLQPELHSALWAQNSVVYLRLQRRKHRPQGSLLSRPCRCGQVGHMACIVHR
eukprot:209038-Amphidinium_carterae.1